jgi:DNA mismatch endonuclease (patch repair protein)
MTDTFDKAKRSWIMARIPSKGTKPEALVVQALTAAGLHFQQNRKELPGKPDIVFPELKLVVFVNGCFWHWHGCRRSRMPSSNVAYWQAKISLNVSRDRRTRRLLSAQGWHYATIWECTAVRGVKRLLGKIEVLRQKSCSS